MADGTTYSPAIQQTLGGTPGQPGWVGQGLGFSPADIAQLQQAGISVSDLQQMQLTGGPTISSPGYGGSGGQAGTQQSTTAYTPQQQQYSALLRAMLKIGGGGQQQQQQPPPGNAYGQAYPLYATDAQGNPTGKPIYANPTNQMSLLGAAALGGPAVINPPPSGTPSSVSGVAPTPGALIGSTQPTTGWNWDTLAHAAGMTSAQIAPYMKSGQTPAQVGQSLGLGSGATPGMTGPWTNPQFGSVFTPVTPTAPTKVTPLQGATQATATGYNPTATPFAQAPPAPGLQIPQTPFAAAHTNALADAGRALFAHFGGDPTNATPGQIADFHNQLTDHLTGALAAAPQPTAAKKMASGGVVPGRGNKDTVPALLTPGEYVIPKDQVAQFFGGRTPAKMAGGGFADPDPDPNAPPEARRKTLSAQTSQAQPPAAPGGSSIHPALTSGLATAAQAYGSSMANLPRNPIGSGSGVDIRNTRLDPDPDLPSLKAAGMLGGGGMSQGMQSALGGIGSGLSQAAQAIASSVHPWQMQQSAIPTPPPAPAAPQFTQPPAPQQAQQGVNPYAAYARNQAMYPTSPYYS